MNIWKPSCEMAAPDPAAQYAPENPAIMWLPGHSSLPLLIKYHFRR
jgi:hypothetical protein